MTSRLADGLYEQVVTGALARDLNRLETGRAAEVDALDSADAHSVLARHVAQEVERALASVPADGRAAAQVAVVVALGERKPSPSLRGTLRMRGTRTDLALHR